MTTNIPEEVAPHRSHKNTKKFCRGKPGVLHDFYWIDWAEYKQWAWAGTDQPYMHFIQVCVNCGKIGKFDTICTL